MYFPHLTQQCDTINILLDILQNFLTEFPLAVVFEAKISLQIYGSYEIPALIPLLYYCRKSSSKRPESKQPESDHKFNPDPEHPNGA